MTHVTISNLIITKSWILLKSIFFLSGLIILNSALPLAILEGVYNSGLRSPPVRLAEEWIPWSSGKMSYFAVLRSIILHTYTYFCPSDRFKQLIGRAMFLAQPIYWYTMATSEVSFISFILTIKTRAGHSGCKKNYAWISLLTFIRDPTTAESELTRYT